ncbi:MULTISPECIES: hypothetical protein [unclassified Streptomyces]|uniref:hypothetical protein n=1 Tax=unclassified Streptomyces TaxID=2593676 RepID=UPI002DD91850|nr:hypothetical protein [Streptomyces sp. NBC_01775]WSB79679.1 hypothetical protein OHB04_30760 [Streptomyces sp. NBC_01775]WSS40829.1 hypothetical protein OG220_09610 [Streptomyces sp. NBC_01187]
MDNHRSENSGRCAACGWPLRDPYTVVSRHPVTEGVIVYTRCACGTLRGWLERAGGGERLVVGGRSTVRDDDRPRRAPDDLPD